MSVTTLFNSEDNNKQQAPRTAWSSIQATAAVTVFLLIAAFLVAVGCSKKSSHSTVSSENQNPSMSAYNSVPPTPAASPVASTAVASTPKKPSPRKRPYNVTYRDKMNGISFRYPRKYTLKSGNELEDLAGLGPVGTSFVQPGGMPLVAVEMPEGSYSGTDFRSAYFDVSANGNLTPEQCSQFSVASTSDGDANKIEPTRVSIGGVEFDVIEDFTGQVMKQTDAKYYHTYQEGVCYEFALGLSTAEPGIDDQVTPVNREAVFNRLERILASVKITGMSEEAKVALSQPPVESSNAAQEQKPVEPLSGAGDQTAKATEQTIKSDDPK